MLGLAQAWKFWAGPIGSGFPWPGMGEGSKTPWEKARSDRALLIILGFSVKGVRPWGKKRGEAHEAVESVSIP
jgi:hypothetical protein